MSALASALQSGGFEEAPAVAIARMIVKSGPLPPPEDLGAYEAILPGSADRILGMAEQDLEAKTYAVRTSVDAEAKGTLAVARSAAAAPFIMGIVLMVSAMKEWGMGALGGSIGLLITGAPRLIDSIKGNSDKEDPPPGAP